MSRSLVIRWILIGKSSPESYTASEDVPQAVCEYFGTLCITVLNQSLAHRLNASTCLHH